MVDTKKEQERDELHRAIWAISNDFSNAIGGWDFKNYVLGTMFYRYISENLTNYINAGEHNAGNTDFDYAKLSDIEAEKVRARLVEERGFFILPSELFCNVNRKADNDEDLSKTLGHVFDHIEVSAKGSSSESSFAGLFDDFDVNSNKLGATVAKKNERLVKFLHGIANMNLGDIKGLDIDIFGDAYEYLIAMHAPGAKKPGGEFFTPADVSELLIRLGTVGKTEINNVYDPTCGSGSLLLKAEKILGKDAVRNGFFGQEINITTYNLCRINMLMHDIGFDKFDIACEDTLTTPKHCGDELFELIVSNPPYSIKWAGDDNPLLMNDPRFSPAGVLAPKTKADFAFIMHSLSLLAHNGTAAIVCFPGILSRTNNKAEPKIRKYLIDNNFIDCIIKLPSNLFFGTSIATCIMVLKKSRSDNKTLFINATGECIRVADNNKLTQANIDRIVETFAARAEEAHFSRLASYEEIAENDYNLSVSTYVEAEDTREKIDIVKLNTEIEQIVAREQVLRDEIAKIITEFDVGARRVEFRKISEIMNYEQPSKYIVKSTNYNNDFETPVLTAGQTFILGYTDETDNIYNASKDNPVIIFDDFTGAFKWVDFPFKVKSSAVKILTAKNNIAQLRYLFYILGNISFSSDEYKRLWISTYSKFSIPVPPLEVQSKIVRILDNFTHQLTVELTAELTMRKKQYEYYRDKLLTFGKIES